MLPPPGSGWWPGEGHWGREGGWKGQQWLWPESGGWQGCSGQGSPLSSVALLPLPGGAVTCPGSQPPGWAGPGTTHLAGRGYPGPGRSLWHCCRVTTGRHLRSAGGSGGSRTPPGLGVGVGAGGGGQSCCYLNLLPVGLCGVMGVVLDGVNSLASIDCVCFTFPFLENSVKPPDLERELSHFYGSWTVF